MATEYASTGGYGIKYMTPTLIAKQANIDDMKQISNITDLDLSFKHSDEHKIEKLEYLDRCKSLKRLIACSQSLNKMSGIQKLSHLIQLDLSGNKITKIEHIKNLKLLQKLDLSFNSITNIPSTMSYLSQLINLNISRNKIQNIRDVLNLRQCCNLQKLDLKNNPIDNLNHYRPFTIYYLSQISMFDSKSISQNELIESRQRFERNEIDKLLNESKQKDEEILSLKNNIKNLLQYKNESQQSIQELNQYIDQQKQNINDLNTQMMTQQQLIRNKNDSLLKTRNELTEMEEKYQELQLSMHHMDSYQNEQKDESESLPQIEMPQTQDFEVRLPQKLSEACSVYIDSVQSVNELIARYNDLRQHHESHKENMSVIHEQIVKSNKALNKLKQRHSIRVSVENPFENDEYSRILSEPPSFNMEWNVSPILKHKQKKEDSDREEYQHEQKQIIISDDSIQAKIDEAHRIESEINKIEHELQSKRTGKQRKKSMHHNHNGSMQTINTFPSDIQETAQAQNELVQQFVNLIESMDKIENSFSTKQKLSHSQDFDDLRIKLVKLYIKRYQNEKNNVQENVNRIEKESNNIENQLNDYISNRNQLLLDIHRILNQLDSDCIDANNYQFLPKSYTDNLPEAIQVKYENLLKNVETHKNELEKEKNVADLLRNQMQQRTAIKSDNSSKKVHDLIVRAETAENRVHQLSFIHKPTSNHKSLQHELSEANNKIKSLEKMMKPSHDKPLQYELSEANNKIKSLEKMLKSHETELVDTLTQKLEQSEIECGRLRRETEEKLSFAKYLMTTKEQRLEAEKTINVTLQREINEMKEQSEIFSSPAQYNKYHSPLQQHAMQSYTEPLSMNQSMNNKRLFDSQPIQNTFSKNLLINDHDVDHEENASEHDAVRLNIDDDDLLSDDCGSATQSIVQLSLRLSNLRTKVQSEEENISLLESKKVDLTQECTQCLETLNEIQADIAQCKDKKTEISNKLDEIEIEHKENKRKQQQHEESQSIVQELRKKSQEYGNRIQELEHNTNEILTQKDNAQKELEQILKDIEDKQQEYNQIAKRIEIKNFELSNLETKEDENEIDSVDDDIDDEEDAKESMLGQIPTKRFEDDLQNLAGSKTELNNVCNELASSLRQLNAIKTELRNHKNYHKIIRLDAIETEIEERIKELSRLKNELKNTRNMERKLHGKIAENAQASKNIKYEMKAKQNELNNKLSEIECIEKALNKKNMELLGLNKNYDKKNKKLMKLNSKLNEAEQLLKDVCIEQNNASLKLSNVQKELYSKGNELECSMDLLRRSSTTNDAIKLFKVIEQIEAEQRALNDIHARIESGNNELKSLKNNIETHKKQIIVLQNEENEMKNSLKAQTNATEINDNKINELHSKINDLQRNKRNLNREIQSEESNLNDIKTQVDVQRDDVRKLKLEHNETDNELNDKRYKLMSVKDDLSETKNQLNTLKNEYDKIKARIRSKNKHSKQQPLDMELYKIYKKDESERDIKLENYNKHLIEMNKQVNAKKLLLLTHENELDGIKNKINESNQMYKGVKEENIKIQREIQVNKGKLSIYEKEIEKQRHCLDALYEKKRLKTVELFKEKSSEIKDANNRLQQLQIQINAVSLELDSKKRILSDINEEKQSNEHNLQQQQQQKVQLQQELLGIKQNIAEYESKHQNKAYELQSIENQLCEMTETLNKMKRDITKRSDELLADKSIELQAIQFQMNKGREEIIELNQSNLQKQNKENMLNENILQKENEIVNKKNNLQSIEQEIEKNSSELGEIDAKIQLKNKQLSQLKNMIADFSKERENLLRENEANIQFNLADIEQELKTKDKLLSDTNVKHNKLLSDLREQENKLLILTQTIKKRSDDHAKLENEIRECSFESLQVKTDKENGLKEYQSLTKNLQHTQLEYDELSLTLHEIKTDLSSKKRELSNVSLLTKKEKSSLTQIQNDLTQLNDKKESLVELNSEINKKTEVLNDINNQTENGENELERVRNNINTYKQQYDTITKEITNLNNIKEGSSNDIKAKNKQLQKICSELERVKLDLELESDELYTSKSERLKVIMTELSKKSKELNDNKKKQRSVKDLLLLKQKELSEKQTNIQLKNKELTEIKTNYNDIQRKLKNKRNELRVITMEIQRHKLHDNYGTNVDEDELSSTVQSNKAKLAQLEQAILEKKKEFENIKLNMDQYSNDLETLKDENNYYNEEKINKMEEINDLTLLINNKKQELDAAKLEIELKSQQIDNDISQKMQDIIGKIEGKTNELNTINTEYNEKLNKINNINNELNNKRMKLLSLEKEIKSKQEIKMNENNKLLVIKNEIQTINQTLINKQHKLNEIEQELQLKLQQINELNIEFDQQTKDLRQSRNSLHSINGDIDSKNNQLKNILTRINSANDSILSQYSTPEKSRANITQPLDISLEEINNNNDNESLLILSTTTPQIIIRTVEKLRRTIDAMCYPRGGCIFSLSSSINHYNSALNTLENKRSKLVEILQAAPKKMNANLNESNISNNSVLMFELDSDGDNDAEVKEENITAQRQSLAVNDLGKIWEELQTVKKVINKLHLERQHLTTTLNHALSIIQNNENGKENTSMDRKMERSEIEGDIQKVLGSIETQGNVWRNAINAMGNKLKQFELQLTQIKMCKNGDNEMKHILSELDTNICDKKQELDGITKQLDSQKNLLSQLAQQTATISDFNDKDYTFNKLSSSPNMARQLANKMRLQKELNDLKQELSDKQYQLNIISGELTRQANQLKLQQNSLLSSIESTNTNPNNTQVINNRIEEIQKLYKMREKNLKQRIDSYKKELQKRDKELNNLFNNNADNTFLFKKEIVKEMRKLQNERSKTLNRRDLKNQIKERDEQIAFLINHFGKQSNSLYKSQSFMETSNVSHQYNTDLSSVSTTDNTSQALSQIEANLTAALAPFAKNKNKKQNKKHNLNLSAYHFVPATSSSENINNRNKRNVTVYNDDSLLNSIFGDSHNAIQQKQHRSKYQRDTFSSKQKQRKQSSYKKKQFVENNDNESEEDDDDDVDHSNFILDDHENRYKSLDRKYG